MSKKCPHCNSLLDYPNADILKYCPACGEQLLDQTSSKEQVPQNKQCPICCTVIESLDDCVQCPDCGMLYHNECWNDNKGCATYGCKSAGCLEPPPMKIVPAEDINISETTDFIICPQCSTRHEKGVSFCWSCGYTFSSKEPTTKKSISSPKKEESEDFWTYLVIIAIFISKFIYFYYRYKK